MDTSISTAPALSGIHHNAMVTWDPEGTIAFYRDVLGFPIVHCITAKGWGQEGHADFVHLFFDAGNDTILAFFYYFGVEARDVSSRDYVDNGRHIALKAADRAALDSWRTHLKEAGINVSPVVDHEVISSIYYTDPNGYPSEITCPLRELNAADAADAERTIDALLAARAAGEDTAEAMWRHKGAALAAE